MSAPLAAPARTTGGKWEPASPNLMFLAGGLTADAALIEGQCILAAVNELSGKRNLAAMDKLCDERTVFLDSGVFSLAAGHARKNDVTITEAFAVPPEELDGWDQHYDAYCTIATRFADRLWGVVELDQGGAEAATATRARITADTGLVPMPVYHPFSDGWDYYDEIASTHDRICVGGLAGRIPASVRLRLCWTAAERARQHPHLWTHLLGVTPNPGVLSYGLRGSTDSTGWLWPIRWASSWPSWSMFQRMGRFPVGMYYRQDQREDEDAGLAKAMRQATASAWFMNTTLAAVAEDTHPSLTPRKEPTS